MTRTLLAEITGTVWKVHVQAGQAFAAGDELAILESMKMEIPVLAPCAGTVTEIRVAPDDQIHEGDDVLVIDES